MRRQQRQGKKRDEIWDELSGSSDEDDAEVDFDYEERPKGNQTGLLDRMEQQLGSLGLKRGKQEVAEVAGKGKAVRMKGNTNKTFDDVLWQEKSRKNRSTRNLDEGASNMEEETYTKLIAFSEAVKKISLLLKQQNAKGGSNDELQTERLVARRLCREVEVELRQLQPLGTNSTSTSTRARASARRGEEEEEDEDDVDQRRTLGGKREREEGTMQYKRLKGEFEKMKRRFEEIDDALREREKKRPPRQSSPTRDTSASLFGELNVRDDYDSPPPPTSSAQTQRRREHGTAGESAEAKRRPSSATKSVAAAAIRSRTAKVPREADSSSDEEETLKSRAGGGSGRVQLQKQQPKKVVDMDSSLQTLEGELEQLLNLFRDFNELVHAQQPMIDQFEEKVVAAEEQTKSAVTELATGASYSAYGLPLVGAAVGMLIGGPLGAIAGAKGMAAVGVCMVGGMGVGAYVGRQISAKQKQEATLILERYRQQRHAQRHDGQDGQELRSLRRDRDDDDDDDEDDDDERSFDDSDDSDTSAEMRRK